MAASVASPIPEAAVTGPTLPTHYAGIVLDLRGDPIELTAALVDIPSESRHEERIADEVEAALRAQTPGFEILRNGNAVLARTALGRPTRVLLAGHLDTVPAADNLPSRRDGESLHGCGTTDMKSGDAVFLHLAATVTEPAHDLTLVFYDCEEIEAAANGLGRIERELPDWLTADVAILGEPTGGFIEAGCQGTLRVVVQATGTRAHSARSWLGDNAIHKLGAVLDRLAAYQPRSVDIDGCTYREGLSAVRIDGGVAGNVIPDAASVTVNFRFAPDRLGGGRAAYTSTTSSTASTCGSSRPTRPPERCPACPSPPPRHSSTPPTGRCGRNTAGPTSSRFAARGIAAVNYGPGDPNLAHTRDERVPIDQITAAVTMLRAYLSS